MKDRKIKTFVFRGLGFPIKLIDAPMKKAAGVWVIDINMNKLMISVLQFLAHKPIPLTKEELRFVRSHMEMTLAEFGKLFGVTHVAVLKWENGKNKVSPALEFCIRLCILNHLQAKDREFSALYKELSLEQLSNPPKQKIHPITIDAATEDLKIAL